MTQRKERWNSPSLTVSRRVKELRTRRGWSAEKLAAACADAGMPELNRSVIANIENRRRKTVTLEEAFTLAFVLDVAPVHLIVPTEEDAEYDAERYLVAPNSSTTIPDARNWVRGEMPLYGQDPRLYFSEVPKQEFKSDSWTEEEIAAVSKVIQADRALLAKFGFTDLTEGDKHGVDPEAS